ncbi:hypothetical protein BGZ60DRAFT_6730 [Tricladium varicosporioides]|nr:hypothetical protein BGZ60DRAFT_6730 [Hymenoscyphus varicosporioides]
MFSNSSRQKLRQDNHISRQVRSPNDLETGRQDWPLPIGTNGRLMKRVNNYDRSRRALDGTQDFELSDGLFWYQEFTARSSSSIKFASADTFGTSLIKLRSNLKQSKASTSFLQLCIINTNKTSHEILPCTPRLLSSSEGSQDLLAFPPVAVGIEFEQAWGGLSDCACKALERPEELLKVEQLSLNEFRRQFLSHTFTNCKCREFYIEKISNYRENNVRDLNSSSHRVPRSREKSRSVSNPRLGIELPSKGRAARSTSAKAQTAQCHRIFDRTTASFSFTWQRSAPRYSGGINTFLWEKYSEPPPCDYTEVFYQDDRAFPGPRRVLMTISNKPETENASSLMHDMKYFLKSRKPDDPEVWPFMLLLQSDPHSDGYGLLPIFVVFEEMVRDTAIFLQQATDELKKLSFAGRNNASAEKVQYLSHLDDCRESALLGINHAYTIANDLARVVKDRRRPERTAKIIEAEFLKEKRVDLEFLIEQLEDHLAQKIRIESTRMKEHRMLWQCRQISVLTWIMFIWVPLSLLLGVLSINITSPSTLFHHSPSRTYPLQSATTVPLNPLQTNSFASKSHVPRQVTVTETSTSPLDMPTFSPTPTPIPSINLSPLLSLTQQISNNTSTLAATPQPYVFSFSIFLALFLTLPTLSILIPFTGPSITRIILQNSVKLRHSPLFLPLVFFSYYLVTYWVLPLATARRRTPCTNLDTCMGWNGKFLHISDINKSGGNPISTPSFYISLTVVSLICLFNVSLAFRRRLGFTQTFKWLFFGVVIVGSYTGDFYGNLERNVGENIATAISLSGVLPVLYLIGVWGVPQLLALTASIAEWREAGKKKRDVREIVR